MLVLDVHDGLWVSNPSDPSTTDTTLPSRPIEFGAMTPTVRSYSYICFFGAGGRV
jgi:hypothetical protein